MANVAFTPVVGNVRGKAGQTVFTRAANGATIRLRTTPRNPRSFKQSSARAAMAAGARAYSNLNSTNLAAWQAYALTLTKTNPVTGGTYHPSAISVFTGLYDKLKQITPTGTPPSTPPASAFTGDTQVITIGSVTTTAVPLTGTVASVANTKIEILYQPVASLNVVPRADKYKNVGFATIPGTPFQVSVVPSPSFVSGQKIAFAYRSVSTVTGQVSPLVVVGIRTIP